MTDFGRILTAMVTAFDADGNLDLERQTKVIEHLFSNGTDTIVVNGTTGESPTLTVDEKIKLIQHTVEMSRGKGKVIAGTGSNDTQASIELTKRVEECGVDGVLLVNPYYNRPSQEGLYQHFKTIAESTSLPVMLYNIPSRSAVNMTAETVCRLAEIPNITMVKESSGNLGQMTEIIKNTPEDFILYSGDDDLTLPVLAIGGYGIVSVASHVAGQEMKAMINAFLEGDLVKASKQHQELYDRFKALFSAPSPTPVKRVLKAQGIDAGPTRLPLVPLTSEEEKTILSYFQ